MNFHWLSHILGLDNASGPFYLWHSGVGSDLTEYAALFVALHALNCHEPGCWRIGHRVTVEPNGHHFRRCGRHHRERHDA